MKHYDCIAIGTGSAMNIVEALLNSNPEARVAVIDKDDPGGICLTRACIPSKLLIYPAELVRSVEEAAKHGIQAEITEVDFLAVMDRMRNTIDRDIRSIEKSLQEAEAVDYFRDTAEFIEPHTLRVGQETIRGDMILLCTGSRPAIPNIRGLDQVDYLTSDTLLGLKELPKSLIILGGGYIAAEYGHFFSAMGSRVTILGRNPRFLPEEEPEISVAAKQKMSGMMDVLTGHEVMQVESEDRQQIRVRARQRRTGQEREFTAEALLLAAGRASNADLIRPDRGGIETDEHGWIRVDDRLETSSKNVWAFGDATGRHLFKHVANYESRVVYANALLGESMQASYHAVPHAVFASPEIAAVGLGEAEAAAAYGGDNILIGFQPFDETARGEAMMLEECFVKVILEKTSERILGAHIIGPKASILIQELINLI